MLQIVVENSKLQAQQRQWVHVGKKRNAHELLHSNLEWDLIAIQSIPRPEDNDKNIKSLVECALEINDVKADDGGIYVYVANRDLSDQRERKLNTDDIKITELQLSDLH